MNLQRREFLSLLTVAIAAASPASGQAVRTVVPENSHPAQIATPTPNFSGIWVHPYFPGIEPPASGPGPVLNKSRRPDGGNNPRVMVGDFSNPILKPQTAEIVKRHGDISLSGTVYPTPSTLCWPSGVPYIFFQVGVQILQEPDRVTMLYLRDHEVRHVGLNRPHPPRMQPSWYGDSVGYYDGDTLVVDTVGVRTDRPVAMVDMYGTPYSQALHVIERYRLIDYDDFKTAMERTRRENIKIPELDFDPNYRGKHLQLQFTVEDEGVFTMSWSGTITYARPARAWEEHVCPESTHDFFTGKDIAVPRADKPDF